MFAGRYGLPSSSGLVLGHANRIALESAWVHVGARAQPVSPTVVHGLSTPG